MMGLNCRDELANYRSSLISIVVHDEVVES